MKITNIQAQIKTPDRLNIFIDDKFRFSLDISQVVDFRLKIGNEIDDDFLAELEEASVFGKLYIRALEYCINRPRSIREVRDYLYKKTQQTKYKTKKGEIKVREGVSQKVADQVLVKLTAKNYVNDENFARWWIENRNQLKGISRRKLQSELVAKGVESDLVNRLLRESDREDSSEIDKVIAKKSTRYSDEQKFIQYLMRQGFRYDDVRDALDRFYQR